VDDGLAGVECLAGIPGSAGATPIQNVGAYGQVVAQSIVEVVVYDREVREIRRLSPPECGFSYRSSVFKRHKSRWVVLDVSFELRERDASGPICYPELARCLGVAVGETAPLPEVRQAVLCLRRSKGMVLDAADPDTISAGSFFLNPVLDQSDVDALRRQIHARWGPDVEPPSFAAEGGKVKTSAAWLIEQAGFHRGYGSPDGIAISGKHTLALTNRGHGTTTELVALARQIATKVQLEFGIALQPEPVFVGHTWSRE
jgi:UDP-N-acetylmuramate dehydrogenase